MTNYAFVLDANNKILAPTKENKAWYLIRKKHAILVNKYPLTIKLNKKFHKKKSVKMKSDAELMMVGCMLVLPLYRNAKRKTKFFSKEPLSNVMM